MAGEIQTAVTEVQEVAPVIRSMEALEQAAKALTEEIPTQPLETTERAAAAVKPLPVD